MTSDNQQYHWYACVNDLIGGWAIHTADVPSSQLDYEHRTDHREVACFATQEDAEHIASLHNASRAEDRGGLATLRKAVENYICGYCGNRVGFDPDPNNSPYPSPCKNGGCSSLRTALSGSSAAPDGAHVEVAQDGVVKSVTVTNPGPTGDWRERWPHERTEEGEKMTWCDWYALTKVPCHDSEKYFMSRYEERGLRFCARHIEPALEHYLVDRKSGVVRVSLSAKITRHRRARRPG